MSNVLIFIDEKSLPPKALISLQKTTEKSLGEIKSQVNSGNPIFQEEIFDEKYDEHAAMIRSLLVVLKEFSLTHRIYELPEGETMESCTFVDECLIDSNIITNILNEADAEFDRQLEM